MSGKILVDPLGLIDNIVIGVHSGERGSRLVVTNLARPLGQGGLLAANSASFAQSPG